VPRGHIGDRGSRNRVWLQSFPSNDEDRCSGEKQDHGEEEGVSGEQLQGIEMEIGGVLVGDPPDGCTPEEHGGCGRDGAPPAGSVRCQRQPQDRRYTHTM
jgi:hypothetical protein